MFINKQLFEIRCCYWYVKDTILKAIHNRLNLNTVPVCVVTDMSKIQFWKQFTTNFAYILIAFMLLLICQRYNFESNSQPHPIGTYFIRCCYWYVKDTILKAIHNIPSTHLSSLSVVTDMSKIQFWKQFTTDIVNCPIVNMLLLICQRYNFESNSQRWCNLVCFFRGCYWYVKDTILKAIHN